MKHDDFVLHDKKTAEEILDRIRATKINVLIVGGTGVGKSSIINALFQDYGNGRESQAKVGQTSKPETMGITSYELGNLVIWDTPGLGDSTEKDQEHQSKIINILKVEEHGRPLIDLIFLILDASSRDFSSAYTLIKQSVLPNLHGDESKRLLVGINKADMAISGEYWNEQENKPEQKLIEKLDEKVETIKIRIKEETGLDVEPIYFSAGFNFENEIIKKPYNLQKLLSFILERLPEKKRASFADHINQEKENFQFNDSKKDYDQIVKKSILSSIEIYAKELLAEVYGKTKNFVTDPEVVKAATSILVNAVTEIFKIFATKRR